MNALYDTIEEHENGNESVRPSLQRAKTVTARGRRRLSYSPPIFDGGYGFHYA
tara:strand:+ start:138 stop:296 length:159 start_codon:yes stop_codon:yes gene_type:complete